MAMGWREKDGLPAPLPLASGLVAPPTIQGVIPPDPNFECTALWFDSGTRVVSRARVMAWRVSGPQSWPCTLLPVEPTFLMRPDGVVFDVSTGARWDNEGEWMAAQP